MNFREYITKNQKSIQQEKERAIFLWKKSIDQQAPELKELSNLLIQSNSGGKNIRGTLVCLGYDLYEKKKLSDIYKIAAAYEILHTSLLIHDDVMDRSDLRRGKPTVYQALGGDHYGISQAISLGDVGFFLSIKMINETSFLANVKSEIISQFSLTVLDTITGQMLDIKSSSKLLKNTEKEVIKIAELKTAQYTITGPLLLGAMLGGADKKYQKQISRFGEKLGIAFQIQDDILGIFGDEKTVGKSVTSDIEEGKNTILIAYARAHGSKVQNDNLKKYYGSGKISQKKVLLIKQIFEESGALEYAEKKIEQFTTDALSLIPQLTKDKKMQGLFTDFVAYLIKRKK